PSQPAAGASGRWRVAQQRLAELPVSLAVPDLAQALLCRVAEREAVVAAHREGRDAAGQRLAVRGEVHQRPRTAAQRPGLLALLPLEARARLGGARGVEGDAELPRERIGLADETTLVGIDPLEQRRFRTGQALALGEIHQALQVHLRYADLMRQRDKRRQL